MLDSLRAFRLVARTGSFTEAARAAALTRPAVSQHVKKLEAYFGTRLFVRTTRRVGLTRAGHVLLEHAERVLAAAAEMEAALAALRDQLLRTLEIGASTLPGEYLVPGALVALRAAFPEVEARVRVGDTDAVLGWVRTGQVDLGLIGREPREPGLVVDKLCEDEIVLALPPGWDVSAVLSLHDLARLPLVLREPGSATRATVLEALEQAGVQLHDLRVAAQLGSPEAVKTAVRAGVGAAFLSWASVRSGEFRLARVEGVRLSRPVCAVWRPDRPPSEPARTLLEHLRRGVDTGPAPPPAPSATSPPSAGEPAEHP